MIKTKFIYSGLILILLVFTPISVFSYEYNDKIFGTKELKSKRLKVFSKWLGMLEKYREEFNNRSKLNKCKEFKETHKKTEKIECNKSLWDKFILLHKNKSLLEKLELVNKLMNDEPYITDPINWGLSDYWATPFQFSVKDGDCEDYAISKYMLLKDMGFPKEDMRIVVLNDNNLKILHAVLAVYTNDGKIYILDNQISSVVEDKEIYHYKPVYSINELYWWKHI